MLPCGRIHVVSDQRPGFEVRDRRWPRLPRGEVLFGLGLGLLMAAALVAAMPDVRHHMFGGTDLRSTTVLSAESRPRSEGNDREVAHYRLAWRDDDGTEHASTFRRSGPLRHEAGDTWELWVSPDRVRAHDEAPWVSWLWLCFGIPIFSLAIGWLWQWRSQVLARSMLRGVEAREARRIRRAGVRR